MRGLQLGYIIRGGQDLYVVPQHRGAANFVTSKRLDAQPVRLTNRMTGATDLFGKLVCIECADPGFDWIFTKGSCWFDYQIWWCEFAHDYSLC